MITWNSVNGMRIGPWSFPFGITIVSGMLSMRVAVLIVQSYMVLNGSMAGIFFLLLWQKFVLNFLKTQVMHLDNECLYFIVIDIAPLFGCFLVVVCISFTKKCMQNTWKLVAGGTGGFGQGGPTFIISWFIGHLSYERGVCQNWLFIIQSGWHGQYSVQSIVIRFSWMYFENAR